MEIFETVVQSGERGRVFINVPFNPVEVWGKQSRYYVRGTINDTEFDGSLGVRGGQYFMPLNKELRAASGINPGDTVRVSMNIGEAVQDDMPDDFADGLRMNPEAKRFFDELTIFQQNTYIAWVDAVKGNETRQKRIQQAVDWLIAGKRQP